VARATLSTETSGEARCNHTNRHWPSGESRCNHTHTDIDLDHDRDLGHDLDPEFDLIQNLTLTQNSTLTQICFADKGFIIKTLFYGLFLFSVESENLLTKLRLWTCRSQAEATDYVWTTYCSTPVKHCIALYCICVYY